nr:MAG: hypothetical protein 3 [Regressovirinae sp.]
MVRNPSKQRWATAVASLSAGSRVGFHNSSYKNVVRALEERVFRVKSDNGFVKPPQPTKGALRMRKFAKLYLSKVGPVRRHTYEDVVNCYKAGKKILYRRAAESLLVSPISAHDAKVTAFVKVEKFDMGLKDDPCPRLIQPRSKRYNVELGTYLRLNEKHLTNCIDSVFGEKTVLSGLDSFDVGRFIHMKWKKYMSPCAIGIDASRFDQHTSVPALKFEHGIWNSIFRDPSLKRILGYQLYNKGIAFTEEGKAVRYKTNGCRMSGDINTSLGNKLIMCAMMWSYLDECEISASLVNNGDDCVLICERDQIEKIESTLYNYFIDKGYSMTMEKPVYCMEKIEFCRSQPVAVGNSYHMVRGISSLSRDCVTLLNVQSETAFKEMMCAVGYCGMVVNNSIPVHSRLHHRMFELGGSAISRDQLEKFNDYNNLERMGKRDQVDGAISDKTRLSYFRAFGIEPHRQLLLESYYGQATVCARTEVVKELPLLYASLHTNSFLSN